MKPIPLGRLVVPRTTPAAEAGPYVALEHVEAGTGRLVRGLEFATATQALGVEPGDLLYGKLRPYLAKAWLVDRKSVV